MKVNLDTLPPIMELTDQEVFLSMVPETLSDGTIESDPIITGVTTNVPDTGVSVSFDVESETVLIEGAYLDQYDQVIKWKRGQLERDGNGDPLIGSDGLYIEDPLQDPIDMQATGWGEVPPSPHAPNFDINLLWYLYQFLPPADTGDKTVTYTIEGTMTTTPPEPTPPDLPEDPEENVPFTVTIDQVVSYDLPTNEAYFKSYFPRGAAAPPIDFSPPGSRPNDVLPYVLPLTLRS